MSRPPVDVAVVGAGPVGLAAAIALRRRGLEVLSIDRRVPPLDKACGEGLMPDGADALRALGVEPAALGRAFAGIRYLDGPHVVEGTFSRPGVGIRRTALQRALAARAEACGVRTAWGETLRGLDDGGVRTDRGAVRARWVVGADGLRSTVRRLAGLDAPAAARRRFGRRRHYRIAPWTDHVEVYWSDRGEAYVTPVADDEVGVAVLWHGDQRRPDDLERFPALERRLAGAASCSTPRGAGPFEQRVRAVRRGRVLLIGDAAGYVDAIAGEGLAVGFHQAHALADALADGRPRRYAAAHRRIVARPAAMTRVLLALAARPALRRRAIATLARRPALFGWLLAVHARDERAPAHVSQCVR